MAKQYEEPRLDLTWREINPGGVVTTPGNSVTYITGTWRTLRPVRDTAQCTNCYICWIVCPDSCVIIEDGKVTAFDYDHCKGCGICANQCPVNIKKPHAETGEMGKVIQMVPETSAE